MKNKLNLDLLFIWAIIIALTFIFIFPVAYKRKVELSYSVEPLKKIFNVQKSLRINASLLSGYPVKHNVYRANITIWNSGRFTIGKEAIKKPLRIRFNNCIKILEYAIEKKTYNEDAHVTAYLDQANLNQITTKDIILNWDNFKPNDAIKLSVSFLKSDDTYISSEADIVGLSKIRTVYGRSILNLIIGLPMVFSPLFCAYMLLGALQEFFMEGRKKYNLVFAGIWFMFIALSVYCWSVWPIPIWDISPPI